MSGKFDIEIKRSKPSASCGLVTLVLTDEEFRTLVRWGRHIVEGIAPTWDEGTSEVLYGFLEEVWDITKGGRGP